MGEGRVKRTAGRRPCDVRSAVQIAGVGIGAFFAVWQLYDQVMVRLDRRESIEIERKTEQLERRLEAEQKYRAALERLREMEGKQ